MKVYFRVDLTYDQPLTEFELTMATSTQRSRLRAKPAFEGAFVLVDGDEPPLEVRGAMEAWTQNLCFDAVSRMLAGSASQFNNFSGPGALEVTPSGAAVRLAATGFPPATFAMAALAPALVGAGQRFLSWARSVKADDAAYLARLDYIEDFAPAAIAALAAAGLPTL